MSLTDLCRLCLSKEKLVGVFGDTMEGMPHMKYIVCVATGVEIDVTDKISQKICERCYQLVLKMFEFRKTALQCNKYLKEQLEKRTSNNITALNETHVGHDVLQNSRVLVKPQTKPSIHQHPSIEKLCKLNPNLSLPTNILHLDVAPSVVLQMDQVENYFNKRKLDFLAHCKLALKRKRTVSLSKCKSDVRSSYTIENGIICLDAEEEEVVHPLKIRITSNSPSSENPVNEHQGEGKNTVPNYNKGNIDVKVSSTKVNKEPDLANTQTSSFEFKKPWPLPLLRKNSNSKSDPNTTKDLKTQFTALQNKLNDLKYERWKKSAINRIPCIELPKIKDNADVIKDYAKALPDRSSSIPTEPVDAVVCGTETKKQNVPKTSTEKSTEEKTSSKKVRPVIGIDVKIKDSHMLNTAEQDPKKVLKNLLLNYNNTSHALREQKKVQVQQKVDLYKDNVTAVLTDMKQELNKYVVPVTIRNGSFKVSYDYSSDKPAVSNFNLWQHLTPIDIEQSCNDFSPSSTESGTETAANAVCSRNQNVVSQSIQLKSSNGTTNTKALVSQAFTSKTISSVSTAAQPALVSNAMKSTPINITRNLNRAALETSAFPTIFTPNVINPATTTQPASVLNAVTNLPSTNATTKQLSRNASPEIPVLLAAPTNVITTLPYNYQASETSLHSPSINSVETRTINVNSTYWPRIEQSMEQVVNAKGNTPVAHSVGKANSVGENKKNSPRNKSPPNAAPTDTCATSLKNTSDVYGRLLYPLHSETSNMVLAPPCSNSIHSNDVVTNSNCNGSSFNIENSVPLPACNVFSDITPNITSSSLCSEPVPKTCIVPTLSPVNNVNTLQQGPIRVKSMSELI